MTFAEIREYNGSPTIFINDEPYAPMSMTVMSYKKEEYIKGLWNAGIKIYYVPANTNWARPGKHYINKEGKECYQKTGFEAFEEEVRTLLKSAPDAYIFVRLGMHPPRDWVESHPDEVMRYSDGGTRPVNLTSGPYSENLPGCYSLCSQAWRDEGIKALNEFCDLVDKSDFADRIIGYFLAAGGTSEWYYRTNIIDLENKRVAGHSPAFKAEFGRILKKKYKTVENLRKAWRMEDASFENPKIPSFDDQMFIRFYDKIVTALCTYESTGKDFNLGAGEDAPNHFGVILNDDKYRFFRDFYDAWHLGTANTIIAFADAIRKKYKGGGKLVGSFYGAMGCTDFYSVSNCTGVLEILNSGKVDFLAAPGVYNNREPGGYVAQREMQDSFRLRNMLFIAEDDSRTHREIDLYRDAGELYTLRDTEVTLKRDFARNLTEGTFSWWLDQHWEGGRYMDEGIYDLFKQQQHIADIACRYGKVKSNEIAIIYDLESMHYVSSYLDCYMIDYYRSSDLGRIGAGVDYYFHDDMSNPKMPDYKVYLMINLFCLTDEEREAIKQKAAKNGATLIWLYAPGLINPEKDKRLSAENMKDLIGINVEMKNETLAPKFRLTEPLHEATKYGDIDRFYGYIDRPFKSNVWFASELKVAAMSPVFDIVDDSVEVLGRYCRDGKPALVMKKNDDGVTNVYCSTPILRSEILASIAEYSGCHLYNYQDDCVFVDNNFLTIHAKFSGKHTIYFKEKCNPFEVYEKKYYGKNVDKIEVEMRLGDTLMFSINDDISEKI